MKKMIQIWKQKRVLRQIKKEIRQETLAITRKAGIKKNSEQYFLVQQDVINGKPHFMGDSYKIPAVEQCLNKDDGKMDFKFVECEYK